MRFKYVLRRLAHSPMFTLIAIATLAIGIGANTAVFSVIEGVLLKPLPFSHPEELIDVDHSAPGIDLARSGIAPFLYFTYRDQSQTFQDLGTWNSGTVSITGLAIPEQIPAVSFTEGMLPILGVRPAIGRWFSKKDDSPGSPDTTVLSYGYWQSRFGGDPAVIGRRIVVDGKGTEVIGVMPRDFQFLDLKPSIIQPMQFDRAKTTIGNFSYQGVARLRPGVTLQQAGADVARMIPASLQNFPPFPGTSVEMFRRARLAPSLRPLKESLVGDVSKVLWVLMGTIGMVLLIACANVANLLLVRADGRQQELAIRAALGAGWGEIVRELLLESLTLAACGGIFALGVAYAAIRLLVALAPAHLPRLDQITIDPPVLLFTLAISILAGLLFGAIPAIKYAGPQLGTALRAGGRSLSQSRERHRARNALVILQVALALVLLASSGLMIRTFQALRRVEPGFTHPEELQTLRISIPDSQVAEPEQTVRMQQQILDKLAAVPGVTATGMTSIIPMTEEGWHDPVMAEDHVYSDSQLPPLRIYKLVSPGLLSTMGQRLIAGRDFTWTDVYQKRPVTMVSENLARELWGKPGNAIGKRIRDVGKGPWREVVGVVSDERDNGVDKEAPKIAFWPLMLKDFEGIPLFLDRSLAFVIRSRRVGSSGFRADVQRAVWSVNPNVPLADVHTLREIYDRSLARTSFTLVMLGIAGAMALLLGVIGIYGVISYSVSQRTREIGIRMALGARRDELTRMFVGQALRLAAIGVALGLVAAAGLMRLMSSFLFEVKPFDPATLSVVSVALIAAAAMASYLPAMRVSAVNPVDALRAE